MASVQPKAPWMTPGAPRVGKPSWLRIPPYQPEPEPEPAPLSPPAARIASLPPPRRSLFPSVPPPSSRRKDVQIQSAREIELEGEVVLLRNELARVTSESETLRARVIEESEPAIVALALQVARRVVGREVAADPSLLQGWLHEAQGILPNAAVVIAPDGQTATLQAGDSTIEVGAEARIAAIADALGVVE